MTDQKNNFKRSNGRWTSNRREFLKDAAWAGFLATGPAVEWQKVLAAGKGQRGGTPRSQREYPSWMTEARIYGLSIHGARIEPRQLKIELERAVKQEANVIEADSSLSAYLSEEDFANELTLIVEATRRIHDAKMKVVWYVPSLEVITPYGHTRGDSFGKRHSDWLQLSFDRARRAVFYGRKVFWIESNDESAWMCPNSPYREWFKARLERLTETGIDGLWIDTILFSPVYTPWGCACPYCRDKFTRQTGLRFPHKFDLSDRAFWRYVQWRHETLAEFLEDCRETVTSVNPEAVTIAEVPTADHLGATQYGLEGTSIVNHVIAWQVEPISDTTAMAEASYEDWLILHGLYHYCRGAALNRPSWAYCYGYSGDDAQLVMASAVASQNNPYELRIPEMTTSMGMEFRGMMYRWIAGHAKPIYQSTSIAPVAVLYSPRNRDFLDAYHTGGVYIGTAPPGRDRRWRGAKAESPWNMEYMGDYRGLSLFLFEHQIPTDIYPINCVNGKILQRYKVLVLPYMAILTRDEKELSLQAVRNGATLIVSGTEPGRWDADGRPRQRSLWDEFLGHTRRDLIRRPLGKGGLIFWKRLVGRDYLRGRDKDISAALLSRLQVAGVDAWINKKTPVVIQPYRFGQQIIIHVLNYSWVGGIENKPRRLPLELSIPWESGRRIEKILQSEPSWNEPRTLAHLKRENKILIPLNIGIHALLLIHTK